MSKSIRPLSAASQNHFVQFFESDPALAEAVAQFVGTGLREGAGVLVIATPEHLAKVTALLSGGGTDVERFKKNGQLILLDAQETLSRILKDDHPDRELFDQNIGGFIEDLTRKFPRVRAYGEMVGLLWNRGNIRGTIALERLWSTLGRIHSFSLFSGYALQDFGDERNAEAFSAICEIRELEARRQEEKFRLMVESVKDYAIFMLDPDGKVATWNEGAKRIKGYEAREIIGQHFSRFYPEEEKHSKPPMELQVAAKVGRFEDEGWRIRKDGSRFWANVIITALRDESGKLVGFAKVTRDLTERKRGETEFERQATMFDTALSSSPDTYSIFDTDLRIIYANRAQLDFWGFTREQALGKRFSDLQLPVELVQTHQREFQEVLRTQVPVRGETPYVNSDGQTNYYEYVMVPIVGKQGKVEAVSVSARDVTERIRAERELRASQGFLDSVIENIPNMVFVKDARNLKFVGFNRAGEELLGLSSSELIGKSDYDFFPKEDADRFVAKDREVLNGPSIVDIPEEFIETKTNGRRILHTRKIPIFGQHGKPMYLLGISEDITEKKKAQQELLRITQEQARVEERRRENVRATFLAEVSTVLASSLDFKKTLHDLARLTVPTLADWCTITMLKEDGVKERVAQIHCDPEKSGLIDELARYYSPVSDNEGGIGYVINTGKSVFTPNVTEAQLASVAKDRRHFEIMRELSCSSCVVVPIFARGKVLGAISLVSGQTERIYDENDLALAEELGRRAGIAIDNALLYEAAQKAIEARDEFLSIASHELKTPLTSLKLQAQIRGLQIKRGDLTRFTSERLSKLIADDEKQINRLTRLVDDMLDISRVQSGRMSYSAEDFDLNEMVQEALARYTNQIEAARSEVKFRTEGPAIGHWDRFRIEQVFVNLLSNALKYGEGKPIEITISEVDGNARLSVRDYGMGISQEDQTRVFNQFERAISATSISGLGLGLYISKNIVEAHHGHILLESEPGKGSVFTVELPLKAVSGRGLGVRLDHPDVAKGPHSAIEG